MHRMMTGMHVEVVELVSNSYQGAINIFAVSIGASNAKVSEDARVQLLLEEPQDIFMGNRIGVDHKRPQTVAGAAEHQRFQFPKVKRYFFQQIRQAPEWPPCQYQFSSLHGQMLDGGKANPHGTTLDNTGALGKIHVRSEQLNSLADKICRNGPQWIMTTVMIEN